MLFFFQAEDGIRYLVRSRGLGDVYKRQECGSAALFGRQAHGHTLLVDPVLLALVHLVHFPLFRVAAPVCVGPCLLYTSDAADERSSVDLGGRRIIKKKKTVHREIGRTSN